MRTRVFRTYRGGKLLDEFLGKEHPADCFQPEDWISSFTEAKNKNYIPNEEITREKWKHLFAKQDIQGMLSAFTNPCQGNRQEKNFL